MNLSLFKNPTPYLFFTGKGGVGKTSTACAAAIALSDAGKDVLLVCTDPASNVDEVLETPLRGTPTAIVGLSHLKALNVNPEEAAAKYRERVIGPYRGVLPEAAITSIEEQLAGACTVEIAAFDEFAKLLADSEFRNRYDHIIFDTAPTGHTLRLLSLPLAWSGYIEKNTVGTSCIGPLQGMVDQKELYNESVEALTDSRRTTLVLVSRPEKAALSEAARTSKELKKVGITNQQLVVNGVFETNGTADPIAEALAKSGKEALDDIPEQLSTLETISLPLKSGQLVGVDSLRYLLSGEDLPMLDTWSVPESLPPEFGALVEEFSGLESGLLMTMGKGGVGKTTVAIELARALVARGKRVLLTTTDPAANVRTVENEESDLLQIGEIDPAVEVERYRAEVLATTGANLDENGLALLQEDLSSPCTEEIAVFQAFARVVEEATDRIVVLDTAPTGHTILLLDAAQSFHREVQRQARSVPVAVTELLPRLRDPAYTFVILCTLAEATPVHEAEALQDDLRRAGIEPFAWLINQSLVPLEVQHSILQSRRIQEGRYIDEVCTTHANRSFILPWRADSIAQPGIAIDQSLAAV